jgi:hypothetical protein
MSNEPVIRGYVVGAGEGLPGRGSAVKASGRSTGGSLTVIEITVDQGPPRHTHTREDESPALRAFDRDPEAGLRTGGHAGGAPRAGEAAAGSSSGPVRGAAPAVL